MKKEFGGFKDKPPNITNNPINNMEKYTSKDAVEDFETAMKIVKEVRNVKREYKIPNKKIIPVRVECKTDEETARIVLQKHFIEKMAGCKLSFLI